MILRRHPHIDKNGILDTVAKKAPLGKSVDYDLLLLECAVRLGRYPGVMDYGNRADLMIGEGREYFEYDMDAVATSTESGPDAAMVLCAVMDLAAHRLFTASDTPNRFLVSEGLGYDLLATEVKGMVGADLHMPCPGFLLSVPPVLELTSQTGVHRVHTLVVFTETAPEGRTLTILLIGGSGTRGDAFDNQIAHMSMPINDDVDIDTAFNRRVSGDNALYRHWNSGTYGLINGQEVTAAAMRTFVSRYVCNFLLYLNSDDADIQHIHAAAIAKLKGVRKVDKARKARLEADRTFVVGTRVKVNHDVKAAVEHGKTAATLTYRTLVRGHWRKQACGAGRLDRKLRWIQPHVRGKDLPDTSTAGHTYVVG